MEKDFKEELKDEELDEVCGGAFGRMGNGALDKMGERMKKRDFKSKKALYNQKPEPNDSVVKTITEKIREKLDERNEA